MYLELVANQDKSPFLIERPFIEVSTLPLTLLRLSIAVLN